MPIREWSPLTTHFQVNLDDSVPRQRAVVGIGEHHAASPNKLATLDLFRPGGRLVTPNYYVWRKEVWGIVPETRKAHTTSSSTYDHSSITKEIANSAAGEPWPFDEETLDTVARLDADIAAFYGIPFRHGLPGFWEHKNVYPWTGGRESYQTACAGPSFHINDRIAQAAAVGQPTEPTEEEDDMKQRLYMNKTTGVVRGILESTGHDFHIKDEAYLDFAIGHGIYERWPANPGASTPRGRDGQYLEIDAAAFDHRRKIAAFHRGEITWAQVHEQGFVLP